MNKPDYARENTVAAEKQLRGGPYFPGRVDACPRILFVGNSITLHGRKPEIGWNVEWGMAASAKENDYVHRTMAGVQKAYPNADFAIVQQATWERNFWTGDAPLLPTAEARDWKPHVVIIRLGENTPAELLKNGDYAEALVSLARFYGGDTAEYLVTDEFWPNEAKDDALRRAAETLNAAFVRISDLGELLLHFVKAADDAGLVLQLVHGGLGADDHVPHALPGDAAVFGNLRQRQVLVVVEVKQLALPFGEDVTVKIEQHGHAVGLVFHGCSSFCKVIRLYNSEYLTRYRPKSQDEMWRRLKIFQKKETAAPSLFRVRRYFR